MMSAGSCSVVPLMYDTFIYRNGTTCYICFIASEDVTVELLRAKIAPPPPPIALLPMKITLTECMQGTTITSSASFKETAHNGDSGIADLLECN